MTREELERELQERLRLVELSPGVWVGRTAVPGLATLQPFVVMVRLLDLDRKKEDTQSEEDRPTDTSSVLGKFQTGTSEGSVKPQKPGAVAVAINLGLRVHSNHQAVYEYLLKVNGTKAIGAFILSDNDEIAIATELPCGAELGNYLSREALGMMLGALLGTVKEHYHRIAQLVAQQSQPADVSSTLDKFRSRPNKSRTDY